MVDIHNFHYESKYKHLIPLVCKDGLLDYEVLIKNNFNQSVTNLIKFLKKHKIYPLYIIIKNFIIQKEITFINLTKMDMLWQFRLINPILKKMF